MLHHATSVHIIPYSNCVELPLNFSLNNIQSAVNVSIRDAKKGINRSSSKIFQEISHNLKLEVDLKISEGHTSSLIASSKINLDKTCKITHGRISS